MQSVNNIYYSDTFSTQILLLQTTNKLVDTNIVRNIQWAEYIHTHKETRNVYKFFFRRKPLGEWSLNAGDGRTKNG